uniref:Uncharacterized protein n=1 Tax=Otus sunia TaxID=257818 RepID=A0A8C8AHB5_9STRI
MHPQSSPWGLGRAPSTRHTWIWGGWVGETEAGGAPAACPACPRAQVDASGAVLELPQGGCPWKEHVLALERALALPRPLQLVLFPDRSGQWRVQSVPTGPHTFQSRLPLPEPWRGVRDEALSQLTGIPGCVFVHASGFIGGNRTREGALEMARRTLAQRHGEGVQSG